MAVSSKKTHQYLTTLRCVTVSPDQSFLRRASLVICVDAVLSSCAITHLLSACSGTPQVVLGANTGFLPKRRDTVVVGQPICSLTSITQGEILKVLGLE